MITTLHGTGIELTDAIRDYVDKKIEGLQKFMPQATKIEVNIGMRNHHHLKGKIFFAEMEVHQPAGNLLVEKEAEDLYKAIDKVKPENYKNYFEYAYGTTNRTPLYTRKPSTRKLKPKKYKE